MRAILVILALLLARLVHAQERSVEDIVVPVAINRAKEIESRIQTYADSINFIQDHDFPRFLFDPCMDLDKSLWVYLEPRASVRWSILEKVTNKRAIEDIANSKDKRLKSNCAVVRKEWRTIPYLNKSFKQLARIRLGQIE